MEMGAKMLMNVVRLFVIPLAQSVAQNLIQYALVPCIIQTTATPFAMAFMNGAAVCVQVQTARM